MADGEKRNLIEWARFIVGVLLFAGLIGVHVFLKELPIWLLALPAALWGVDVSALWGKK